MKGIRFLLLILCLTGCAAAGRADHNGLPGAVILPMAARPEPSTLTFQDSWRLTVPEDGDAAGFLVERQLTFEDELAPLLRGSAAISPRSFEESLEDGGARNVACQQVDGGGVIRLSCRYWSQLLAKANGWRVPLPAYSPLAPLSELPLSTAQGLRITSQGAVNYPGTMVALPASYSQEYANGGFSRHTLQLNSPSGFSVYSETFIPPGNPPAAADSEPGPITLVPARVPESAAWLALLFGLVAALAAIVVLLPVSARLPREPRLWHPDLSRVPVLIRWLAVLLVALVNWLRQNWPLLLNSALAVTLLLWGAQTLFLTWSLARVFGRGAPWVDLPPAWSVLLPLGDALALIQKPAGLLLLGLFGLLLLATGFGLLVRWRPARIALLAVLLATMGAFILLWPRLILAPPLAPLQLELVLGFGSLFLFALVFLARWLGHPQFRRYYLRMAERT